MKPILFVDAAINFILGVLLLFFSPRLADFLGVPSSSTAFYPSILGAIFIGITIGLLIEAIGKGDRFGGGLGLTGAVSINLGGGIVLAFWLIFGGLQLPVRGLLFLWVLVFLLVAVSLFELIRFFSGREKG